MLLKKFTALFADLAKPLATDVVGEINNDASRGVKSSLSDLAKGMTLDPTILTTTLKGVLTASIAENVNLITTIPEKYLGNISSLVLRKIQYGDINLKDELDMYAPKIKNWAHNVALDQTRKAYAGISKCKLEDLGIKKFEWMHSGGSSKPRIYHQKELNGKIFSFDDLPIINPSTGERGLPAQLPYCRCKMKPVIEFED